MDTTAPLVSATAAGARIAGHRCVPVPAATLPARSLGLGPFTVGTAPSGLPTVVDPSGRSFGSFANPQLAAQTAAALSAL